MSLRIPDTPAVDRLRWILDGLDGAPNWGGDAAEILAPEFLARVPAARYVEVVRVRAALYAPVSVIGLAVEGHYARARIAARDGGSAVVHCRVEAEPPHRITETWTAGFVPDGLTPRLPFDFADHPFPPAGSPAALVVFSGMPGSGKSTLADAVGRALGVPVFAVDWLLGALTPFGGRHADRPLDVGAELLTTLAYRQLALGQSAILDSPAEDLAVRVRWRSLAERAGAAFVAVHCVCADLTEHRRRVEGRTRGIPGWHDPGDWADVVRRTADFVPWDGDALVVDTARPLADIVAEVIGRVRVQWNDQHECNGR